MASKTQSDVAVKVRAKVETTPPREHKVIYLNDDTTPMDFVIESLVHVFGHSDEIAETLTTEIHERGSAVVAVLPFEIAEHKGVEVTLQARAHGYPLQVKIEPE